jgi:hypothetical protein
MERIRCMNAKIKKQHGDPKPWQKAAPDEYQGKVWIADVMEVDALGQLRGTITGH